MSVRGTFREALQTQLQTQLGVPFYGGRIEGRSEIDVGCVWWEGKRPFARDGNVEENYYRARVLRRFMQDQGADSPRIDTVELLEATAESLEAALKAVLTTAGHDFFNVTEITVDYQAHYVEAQLLAYDRNRTSAGG